MRGFGELFFLLLLYATNTDSLRWFSGMLSSSTSTSTTKTTTLSASSLPHSTSTRATPVHLIQRTEEIVLHDDQAQAEEHNCKSNHTVHTRDFNVTICEYVNSRNRTLLGFLGSDREKLEMFSVYKLGRNLSASNLWINGEKYAFQQRNLDLRDIETKKSLLELWRSESLLSQSADPLNVLQSRSSFEDLLHSYATRVEMLRNESKKDPQLLDFLANQEDIHNVSWTEYIRRPHMNLNETISSLKSFSTCNTLQIPCISISTFSTQTHVLQLCC